MFVNEPSQTCRNCCEENRLIHNIAVRLPLAKIVEAHELVERGGVSGNVSP